ncbi:DUF6313 family protein [Streptomyces sp. NPDC050439]|uniref:DUF6313 family protein n=1 Tax=unclassified Streptomyces TaxID=2593676 RepID=UPI0034237540
MRSLLELNAAGGDERRFVEEYVTKPHGGDWSLAKDHWTQTMRHIADRVKELEDMKPDEAARYTENLSRTLAMGLAQAYKCWACGSSR